jgi:hypothetical protein
LFALVIANDDKETPNKTSGWYKCTTKSFYHDVIDLIQRARNSRADGQEDRFVCADYFRKCFVQEMMIRGDPDLNDKPIVWATTKARMNRNLGVVKTFEIGDLEDGPGSIVQQDPIVNPVADPSRYFRFNREQMTTMKDKKVKRDDFFGKTMCVKGNHNHLSIILSRILMRSLVKHLQSDETSEINDFKAGVQRDLVFREKLTTNGNDLKALFDNDEAAKNWFDSAVKDQKQKAQHDTWKYAILEKNAKMSGTLSMVNETDWDAMLHNNNTLNDEEMVPLWNTCVKAKEQDSLLLLEPDQGWPGAVDLLVDHGIFSKNFMRQVFKVRHLWQETKLKYILNQGERNLRDLAGLLYPYVVKKKQGWRENQWYDLTHREKTQTAFLKDLFGGDI